MCFCTSPGLHPPPITPSSGCRKEHTPACCTHPCLASAERVPKTSAALLRLPYKPGFSCRRLQNCCKAKAGLHISAGGQGEQAGMSVGVRPPQPRVIFEGALMGLNSPRTGSPCPRVLLSPAPGLAASYLSFKPSSSKVSLFFFYTVRSVWVGALSSKSLFPPSRKGAAGWVGAGCPLPPAAAAGSWGPPPQFFVGVSAKYQQPPPHTLAP